MEAPSAEGVGLGVPVVVGVADDGVDDTVGDGVTAGNARGDPNSVGVGKGESGRRGVEDGVAVAPAFMIRGVDVGSGVKAGGNLTVLVGDATTPRGSPEGAVCNGVTLGTMVMRGIGEPTGVPGISDVGVELSETVGDGVVVGVRPLQEQPTSARVMSTQQINRFIILLSARNCPPSG